MRLGRARHSVKSAPRLHETPGEEGFSGRETRLEHVARDRTVTTIYRFFPLGPRSPSPHTRRLAQEGRCRAERSPQQGGRQRRTALSAAPTTLVGSPSTAYPGPAVWGPERQSGCEVSGGSRPSRVLLTAPGRPGLLPGEPCPPSLLIGTHPVALYGSFRSWQRAYFNAPRTRGRTRRKGELHRAPRNGPPLEPGDRARVVPCEFPGLTAPACELGQLPILLLGARRLRPPYATPSRSSRRSD
jgi:hypothetical protein